MAIYHLSAKPISRAQGRSATGAAAYRAGVEITDERTGLVHDYTRKGGVLHSELILPGGGTADRAEFWNGIEAHHKRGDAVLVREVEISLPTELTAEQRQALAVGYARELADRYGVAADVALHAPRTVTDRELEKNPDQYHETDPETGRRHNGNWHAHIMLSACHVQPDGTLGKKAVELDPIHCQRAKIENMADRERARWGELANAALERHGHEARIDHRSHAAIGRDDLPTVHVGHGPGAHARAQHNRDVTALNQAMRQALKERAQEAARIKAAEAGAFARVSAVFRPMEAPERPPEPTQAPEPEPVDLDALADERRRIDERDAEIQRRLNGLKASMESARRAEQLAERARRERAALADLKGQRAGLGWWGRLTRAGRLDEQISQAQAQLSATCQAGRQAQAKAAPAEVLQDRARELEQERAAAQARRDEIVRQAASERARLAGLHLPRTPTPRTRAAKA